MIAFLEFIGAKSFVYQVYQVYLVDKPYKPHKPYKLTFGNIYLQSQS